jgi:hypothetical protein
MRQVGFEPTTFGFEGTLLAPSESRLKLIAATHYIRTRHHIKTLHFQSKHRTISQYRRYESGMNPVDWILPERSWRKLLSANRHDLGLNWSGKASLNDLARPSDVSTTQRSGQKCSQDVGRGSSRSVRILVAPTQTASALSGDGAPCSPSSAWASLARRGNDRGKSLWSVPKRIFHLPWLGTSSHSRSDARSLFAHTDHRHIRNLQASPSVGKTEGLSS